MFQTIIKYFKKPIPIDTKWDESDHCVQVLNSIASCKTIEQLETSKEMISFFMSKYPSSENMNKIVGEFNSASMRIHNK